MRIAITGKKGHGKDTFAKMIQAKDSSYIITHFAQRIKTVCAEVFEIPEETFHDPIAKEEKLDLPIVIDSYLDKLETHFGVDLDPAGCVATSPRELLQFIGTEYVRKVNPDYWVDYIIQSTEGKDKILVPDMRFLNEAAKFRAAGGTIIKLVRLDLEDSGDKHSSETELDLIEPDLVLGVRTGDTSILDTASNLITSPNSSLGAYINLLDYRTIRPYLGTSNSKLAEALCAKLCEGGNTSIQEHIAQIVAHYYVPEAGGPFLFKKTNPAALAPQKSRNSDSGYDLHLVEKISEGVSFVKYNTGIQVQPPEGMYFDMVVRSSLHKKGYMLANNVGIIDNEYRGDIIVVLYKMHDKVEELELPYRAVQIIPRHVIHRDFIEVPELDETSRGAGGFGSTDKKG